MNDDTIPMVGRGKALPHSWVTATGTHGRTRFDVDEGEPIAAEQVSVCVPEDGLCPICRRYIRGRDGPYDPKVRPTLDPRCRCRIRRTVQGCNGGTTGRHVGT